MNKLALLALLGSVLFAASSSAQSPQPSAVALGPSSAARGEVVFVEGSVLVDGKPAEIGAALGPKATIVTGPASSCEIVFDKKNAIRVGPSARAELDLSGIVKKLRLERGGITAVLRKLAKLADSDGFRVETRVAVAAVRGTSFCVWAEDESTYLCACNGELRTVDAAGANELDLRSAHHAAKLYSKEGSSIGVSPAGLEYHSDASVESLAARIGEKIDWTAVE